MGADKVKAGTPDTLMVRPDGQYICAQYTTQQTDVQDKLVGDLAACFDEERTNFEAKRVAEVVVCCNSGLTSAQVEALQHEGRARLCVVSVKDAGTISHELINHPGIGREYLGIEVDTGQLVEIDEFIRLYGKNPLATKLDTTLRYRDAELAGTVAALGQSEVTVVTGPPGVGKTRLAIEACRSLVASNPEFRFVCVRSRGPDFFDDLRVLTAGLPAVLILVDDANRVSGFAYVLQLLHDAPPDRKVKIVVTVRDYAVTEVLDLARRFTTPSQLVLTPLTNEQVADLIRAEFGIANHRYIDRIAAIAQGNVRLAVMAAQVAIRENTLDSISDASALYREHFASVQRDLEVASDPALVKIAGLVSLFRVLQRDHGGECELIRTEFGIEPEKLWAGVQVLHEMEMVDLYEDEIVKVSDQVLATYFFHAAFFERGGLDLGALLRPPVFPAYRSRLIDALNPVLSVFGANPIGDALRKAFDARLSTLEEQRDQAAQIDLLQAFGPVDATATLRFVRDRVRGLPVVPAEAALSLHERDRPSHRSPLWSILGTLSNGEIAAVKSVIDLALDLLSRHPEQAGVLVGLLVDRFGIMPESYLRDYEIQVAVIEGLARRAKEVADPELQRLLRRIYVAVGKESLRTHIRCTEMRRNSVFITEFDAPITPAFFSLRETIWRQVLSHGAEPDGRNAVLDVLLWYGGHQLEVSNAAVIAADANSVLPMLDALLDGNAFSGVFVVRRYLGLLRDRSCELEAATDAIRLSLERRVDTPQANLAGLLVEEATDQQARLSLSHEEYEALRRGRRLEYVRDFERPHWDELLADAREIRDELIRAHRIENAEDSVSTTGYYDWQLRSGVTEMLASLIDAAPELFTVVTRTYLESGNTLDLEPRIIVPGLIKSAGASLALSILRQTEYSGRAFWLSIAYSALDQADANEARLSEVFQLLEAAAPGDLTRDLAFLLKFQHLDRSVIPKATAILLRKAEMVPQLGWILVGLFEPYGRDIPLREVFGGDAGNVELLKRAYLAASRVDQHWDWGGESFSALLDLDPAFGAEWVEWVYDGHKGKGWISSHADSRDHAKLWLRHDFEIVVRHILARVRDHANELLGFGDGYGSVFFRVGSDTTEAAVVRGRQDRLLEALVAENAMDQEGTAFVFHLMSGMAVERRRHFIEVFVDRNREFEAFALLPLEPDHGSWSGSAVPMLQGRVDFLASLLPMFDEVDFVDHKYEVERRIKGLRDAIEVEKRRDFVGHE
ncbi:MAG TPA: hypothetical protein VGM77_04415 [Gemmatimonadales bacterium]